jgi:excisionase family DNA binding protein
MVYEEIMVDNKFLTLTETANLLRISKPTIERMIAAGTIPSYKVGKRRLFDREELIEWVKSHRNGPSLGNKKEGRRSRGKKERN